ncbi:heme NO-binding domain-containing protein [Haloarcula salinisoli]|uniref:Heme NO-binding domain-containing protein n=1 Tax=Haloarcula salinisoli TaxID=2487746 RepID=A0A8J8CAX0_9EURY|nr:heme NO-binding domain-containing protein [Halomicroarcula salinisoli]MBX0284879.1 heme NO-binding domain-containing protein [Halomicroarcula salinisoli]MBX0303643.1 heme NO-binding domain-containing protein [Halomicroarcula salinisoli]
MHGVVMTGLRSFVIEQHDRSTWEAVKDAAGIERNQFTRMDDYPDEEFLGIYQVLLDESEATGTELQREFGQFLFAEMAEMYGRIYFDDEWGALDLINNVEETIHQSLKARTDSGFTPPELETEPIGDGGVAVLYRSDRQLCEFGKGLLMGTGTHYETELTIEEPQCMKDGDDICRIEVHQNE